LDDVVGGIFEDGHNGMEWNGMRERKCGEIEWTGLDWNGMRGTDAIAGGIIIILYYKYTCVYYIECQIRENENSDGDG
jgi:hypothetical protein